jgi:hypothetical protein
MQTTVTLALVATLARFSAQAPVTAHFSYRYENTSGDGKDAVVTRGEVSGDVSETPAGVLLSWGGTLLERAKQEDRALASNPEAPTPTRDGLAQVTVFDLARRLDAASVLRDQLARATVLDDKPDALDGAPARLLTLKLEATLGKRERRYVKEAESTARLWLSPEGLPLAAETVTRASGRIFLIIGFEFEQRESLRFAQVGDRLVTVRHEISSHWDGAGDAGGRKSLTVLEPVVEPAAEPGRRGNAR